jgi:hypothetical protein
MKTSVSVSSVLLVLLSLIGCGGNLAPTPVDFEIAPKAVSVTDAIQLTVMVPATDPDGSADAITYSVQVSMSVDGEASAEAVEAWSLSGLSVDELDGHCWAPGAYVESSTLTCVEEDMTRDTGVEFANGQVWSFTVEAVDGNGLSSVWNSTYTFEVGNTPPVVTASRFTMTDTVGTLGELQYSPGDTVYGLGDLEVVVDAEDVDGQDLTYSVSWSCDTVDSPDWESDTLYDSCITEDNCTDVTVPAPVEGVSRDDVPVVPMDTLAPCQVWTATGTVSDGFATSAAVSGSVLVGSYQPTATEVTLTSDNAAATDQATVEDTVTCAWTFWDLEAESDVSTVNWVGCAPSTLSLVVEVDPDSGQSYVTTPVSDLGCEKMNTLSCEVLPTDSMGTEGGVSSSNTIDIINALPTYASAGMDTAGIIDVIAGDKITCEGKGWLDPDGDLEGAAAYLWSTGADYATVSTDFGRGDLVWCSIRPMMAKLTVSRS